MSKTEAPIAAPDFSAYLLAETGDVKINLPNGDPMLHDGQRVTVHVYGPASAQYAQAMGAMQRAARDRLFGKKGAQPDDAEADAEANARFLEAVTARIEHFPYPGGLAAIYRERRLGYLADQVRAHLNDQGNFFKPSKMS